MKALLAGLSVPALIFLGAGLGGVMRFWIGGLVQQSSGPAFPIGTLVVNITGCFAAGFLLMALPGPMLLREEVRALLFVGFLGGYTTFSSFGRESLALAADGHWWRLGAYVMLTNILALGAVWVGAAAGRWLAASVR
jgi:fluoride exporter